MQQKKTVWFGLIIALFLLASVANAYTIVGNSVIEEDSVSKLVVTPHTASNPTGQNYEQTFELTNKTAGEQDVYIGYKFDNALVAGLAEVYNPPTFSWVNDQSFTCNLPNQYEVTLDANAGGQNPHFINCYLPHDNNTMGDTGDDFNVTLFQTYFNDYDLDTNTVYVSEYKQTGGDTWSDVSEFFSTGNYLNDTVYYLPNPVTFAAGETKKWRIIYTPSPNDTTNKWELVFYTGSSVGCLLSGTCDYVHWLDPWYDEDYVRYKQITATAPANTPLIEGRPFKFEMDTASLISAGKLQSDCADIRIVSNDTTVLDHNVSGCNSADTNVFFDLDQNVSAGTSNTTRWKVYYDNATALPNYASTEDDIVCKKIENGECYKDYYDFTGDNGTSLISEFGWRWTKDSSTSTATIESNRGRVRPKNDGAGGTSHVYSNDSLSILDQNSQVSVKLTWYDYSFFGGSSIEYLNIGIGDTNGSQQGSNHVRLQFANGQTSSGTSSSYTIKVNNSAEASGTLNQNDVIELKLTRASGTTVNWEVLENGSSQDSGSTTMAKPYFDYFMGGSASGVGSGDMGTDIDNLYLREWYGVEPSYSLGSEVTNNAVPDLNLVYPNSAGLEVSGTTNIDFNFSDADFNASAAYDFNLTATRTDTNAVTNIVTDANAFTYCTNMDSNSTVKVCSYSYDFTNLPQDVNHVIDVNITDGSALGQDTGAYFTVLGGNITLRYASKAVYHDLNADGTNYGQTSEGFTSDETQSYSVNAPNVNRKQYLIVRRTELNAAFTYKVNGVTVGTSSAVPAGTGNWLWEVFAVDSGNLSANPQTVRIEAGSSQDVSYFDYVALADSVDANILKPSDPIAVGFDYNNFSGNPDDIKGVLNYANGIAPTKIDFNVTTISDADYNGFVFFTPSDVNSGFDDGNLFVQVELDISGSKVIDGNKSIIIDGTNPSIYAYSFETDVIKNRSYPFEMQVYDLYNSHGFFDVFGTDYSLSRSDLNVTDANYFEDFSFSGTGDYTVTFEAYDQAGNSSTTAITVSSSDINSSNGTLTFASYDSNRLAGIAVADASKNVDFNFTLDFTHVATGTANINYYTHDYNILDINLSNVAIYDNNGTLWFDHADTNTISYTTQDLNGNETVVEQLRYTVGAAATVEWENSGVQNLRLFYSTTTSNINNSVAKDYWVNVPIRTTYQSSANKIELKRCTTSANWGAKTCGGWTVLDIYNQDDETYHGGTFPTVDTDDDGYKDTLYIKIPNTGEYMFSLDVIAGEETAWTSPTPDTGGNTDTGSSTQKPKNVVEEVVEKAKETGGDIFAGLAPYFGVFGELLGQAFNWIGSQVANLSLIDFSGTNTVIIIGLIAVIGLIIFLRQNNLIGSGAQQSSGLRL